MSSPQIHIIELFFFSARQVPVAVISDPEARAAYVYLLGEHGEEVTDAPYTLEDLVASWTQEDEVVRRALLTAVTKLFFKRQGKGSPPAEPGS